MPSILDFYTKQPQKLKKVVDTTFGGLLNDNESELAQLAPVRNYRDAELLIMRFNRTKPTVASIVGDEQELPVQRARATLTEDFLNETRIGKQYVFKNTDFKAMLKLEKALRDKDAPPELIKEFKRIFFGYAEDLPIAVVEKLTILMIQAFCKASIDFEDILTKARFTISYPDAITTGGDTTQLMFTNTPTTPLAWNTPDTATGLRNLELHALAWFRNFGSFPPSLYLRYNLFLDLKAQTSTKQAIAVRRGYGATVGDIAAMYLEDADVLEVIRQRTKCQKIVFLDDIYSEESESGVVSDKYFLPDDTYFFTEPGIAERAFVPTPEKDFEPGIYVKARELDDAPRKERIVGIGAGIPAIFDGRKIAARKVK